MIPDGLRTGRSRKHLFALIVATSLLLPFRPVGAAEEAAGETEIAIVVYPSGTSPNGSDTSPHGSAASVETEPVAGQPGTLSARFVQLRSNELTERADDAVLVIVIRDDRGSALGWEIVGGYQLPGRSNAAPELLEDRTDTIRRILPDDGGHSNQTGGIGCGQVTGPFQPAIPLLKAPAGGGSGLFAQQLVVVLPVVDPTSEPGTLLIQMPFAP